MPQLWIETWVGQFFWLLVILFIFHFYMVNNVIPTIATILKIRKTLGAKEEAITDLKTSGNLDNLKINLPGSTVEASAITNFASARANWVTSTAHLTK